MKTITITTQAELDKLPTDFDGVIYIEGGTEFNRLDLKVAFTEARVIVRGEAWVRLRGSSHAELWESSHAELWESSHAVLWESSHAVLWGSSHAVLRGSSHAELWGSSHAVLWESSHAVLWGSSHAELWESSHAVLRGSSHAVLWGSSKTQLFGEAMVSAFSAKEIVCNGYNVISVRKSNEKNITVVMNTDSYLKVTPDFEPTWDEYAKRYPIKVDGKKAILYKAVHKEKDGKYHSDYKQDFKYEIGKKITERCDPKTNDSCSYGLHIAHKSWARSFGLDWEDLAILECGVPIKEIVVSSDCDGKVRTSELKVLRELPRDEWFREI
jgi:hypothetical protein